MANVHCDSIPDAIYGFLREQQWSSLSWVCLHAIVDEREPLYSMNIREILNNLPADASTANILCIFEGPHWVINMAPLLPTRPDLVVLVEEPIHMDFATGSPGKYVGYIDSLVRVEYSNREIHGAMESDLEIIRRQYHPGGRSSVGEFKINRIGESGVLVSAETSQVSNPDFTMWNSRNVPRMITMKSFPLLEMDVSKEISDKMTIKCLLIKAAGRASVNKPINFDDPDRCDDSRKLAVLLNALPLASDYHDGTRLADVICSIITRMNLPKVFQIWYLPSKDSFFVSLESKISR